MRRTKVRRLSTISELAGQIETLPNTPVAVGRSGYVGQWPWMPPAGQMIFCN
jgi:hypothetical protein